MTNTWALCALWVGLALAATLLAIWFKISTALSEIVVGTVAQRVIGVFLAQGGLATDTQWITFLAGTGAIVLTVWPRLDRGSIATNDSQQVPQNLAARISGAECRESRVCKARAAESARRRDGNSTLFKIAKPANKSS